MKRHIYFLALALLTVSCVKVIDFDEKKQGNLLVFNAQIKPDGPFYGTVRKSTSILSNASNENVANGNARLFENDNLLSEFTFQNGNFYKPELIFKEGKTYRVEISADDKTISAETLIPETTPVLKIDTVTPIANGYLQFTITFKDNGETKDYYRVLAVESRTFLLTDQNGNTQEVEASGSSDIIQDDPVFNSVYANSGNDLVDLTPENKYSIFPDDYFDGKEYKLQFSLRQSYYSPYNPSDPGIGGYGQTGGYVYPQLIYRKTTLYFQKISKDLYNYLKYFQLYETFKDNPIAEPVPVYSNIKNGAGIFAGLAIEAQLSWEKHYKISE